MATYKDAPNPLFTDAAGLANWIAANTKFILSVDEVRLIAKIQAKTYTGEPSCVEDLHDLRILFWQVVGSVRAR